MGVPNTPDSLLPVSKVSPVSPFATQAASLSSLDQQALQALLHNPRLTPATLALHLDPEWIPAPFLMYVSLRVALAIRKGGGRLIISVPPRHGKSRLLS